MGHALLLARLAADEQDAALKWCLDPNAGTKKPVDKVIDERLDRQKKRRENPEDYRGGYIWEPQSVVRLKDHIEKGPGNKLDRAPWPLKEDYLLPDAGSCLDCPQNTKANAPLFGDLDIGEPTCTDGVCFKAKTVAFVLIEGRTEARAAAQRAGQPPVPGAFEPLRVSWKATSSEPRKTTVKNDAPGQPAKGSIVINRAQVFKAGQWIEAKKHCEHTCTAITVDWSDANNLGYMGSHDKLRKPGEIVQVCVAAQCKLHPKAWEREKTQGANGQRDQAAEKAAEEKRAAQAREESRLRIAVASKALESITSVPAEALRALAISAAPSWNIRLKLAEVLLPGFAKTLKTAKVDSVEFAKAAAIASLDKLDVNEYQGPKYGREEFLASVKRLGYDGSEAWKAAKPAKSVAAKPAKKKSAKPAAKAAVEKPSKKSKVSPAMKKQIAAAVAKRWAGRPKVQSPKKDV